MRARWALTGIMARLPRKHYAEAQEYRDKILEFVAERSDALMEKYLSRGRDFRARDKGRAEKGSPCHGSSSRAVRQRPEK